MPVIRKEMRVGAIATARPETMKVFARYRLDLCCGGAHTVEYVASKHGIDLEKLLAELNEAATADQGEEVARK